MTKKTDPALDEAMAEGGDSVTATAHADNGYDHVAACEAAGLNPDEVKPGDPALTGVSRDERHDSIDPNTGGLTDEATALRAQKLIDEQNAG